MPKERRTCHQAGSDAKLTDGGRKVYGGDGITPDYCVEPTAPSKFMAYLQARQAFIGFSRSYSASETSGVADIAGTGRRSGVTSGKVKLISKDFQVDEKVLADFNAYLDSRKPTAVRRLRVRRSVSAVIAITGISRVSGRDRSRSSISGPSMYGMITSVKMMSGARSMARRSPSVPSRAATTS